ncbi:hypothetical protein AeRB84_006434 [Aphanomyces euteiches]|nr:hypothetical protein AeRB84_006434 [Aphanomyces euteiches]
MKVHDASQPKATARFSRLSLFYTGLFVLKLASTPLLAYLTEPLPWLIPQRTVIAWDSFDAFNEATFEYLHSLYNSHTMDHNQVTHFDSHTLTYVARRQLALPCESIPFESLNAHLIEFPGIMFSGLGERTFCEQVYYYGTVLMDGCIWLEPLPHDDGNDACRDVDMAYRGAVVLESAHWSWFKLILRPLLTLFILHVLWHRYCRHYFPLLHALQEIGVNDTFTRYVVIVGGPTYLILSHPSVSIVMAADIVSTPSYIAWSTLRVCQFSDWSAFCLGCLYSMRFVWEGYLAMRLLSFIAKARKWENKFAPIDPGVPWLCRSALWRAHFESLWQYVVDGDFSFHVEFMLAKGVGNARHRRGDGHDYMHAIDGFLSITHVVRIATATNVSANALVWFQGPVARQWTNFTDYFCSNPHLQRIHAIASTVLSTSRHPERPTRGPREHHLTHLHGQRAFNDVKNRFFFSLMRWHVPEPPDKIGGSLHGLLQSHPEYRQMPLLSCRAADCFVLCYTRDGQ